MANKPKDHGEGGPAAKIPKEYFEKADPTSAKAVVPQPVVPTNLIELEDIDKGLKVGTYERKPGYLVKVYDFDVNHKGQKTVRFQKGIRDDTGMIDWKPAGVPMLKDAFIKWLKLGKGA